MHIFQVETETGPTIYPKIMVTLEELSQMNYPWIREDLLLPVFKGFLSKKSPGTYKLKPIVYKHLTQDYISALVKFLQSNDPDELNTNNMERSHNKVHS